MTDRDFDKEIKQVKALRDPQALSPNIVDVSEGHPEPGKRRASVRLEFYGPDATAKSIEASTAIRAMLNR